MCFKANFLLFTCLLPFSSLVSFCRSSEIEYPGFNYIEGSGEGPEQWGQLRPEWAICSRGKIQSPIDLVEQSVQVYPAFKRDYKSAPAQLVNKGYDIMLSWTEDAGSITISGIQYNLLQVHWHTPTEHVFYGKRHEMELHMVHQSSEGKIAVVGVTYDFNYDPFGEQEEPFLAKLIPSIKILNTSAIPMGVVDPRDINIGSEGYYRYMGSLTTPPCSEGVVWTVAAQVLTVSSEQVAVLQNAVNHGFEWNARPLQPLNNRAIVYHPFYNRGDSVQEI